MKRRPLFLLLPAFLGLTLHGEPVDPGAGWPTLRWNNGEALPATLAEGSAADATWQSPLFDDTLQLRWDALRRLDQILEAAPPADNYSVALRDGSRIYGDLVSISDDALVLHSTRHGDVTLRRAETLTLRRIAGENIIFNGPNGDDLWEALAPGADSPTKKKASKILKRYTNKTDTPEEPVKKPAVAPIVVGPGGAFALPYWNRSAYLDVAVPESVAVDFTVHSTGRPEFAIALVGAPKKALRVETWDDELVLTAADDFQSLRKMEPTEREISLRVCWNRQTGKCAAYTADGALLAEWKAPEDPKSTTAGLVLKNKGRDLFLDRLTISAWDGGTPATIDGAQPRVELTDGRVLDGAVVGATPAGLRFRARGQDAESTIPIESLASVIFSADHPATSASEAAFSFTDGTRLLGKIESVKAGWAGVKTSFSAAPVASDLTGLRQLLLQVPAPAGAAPEPLRSVLDKLVIQTRELHGTVAATGDSGPRWSAVGSLRPSIPKSALVTEIDRHFPADAEQPASPALFFTSAGDVLPGELRGLDRTGADIQSGFVETSRLPADSLLAVQFGAAKGLGREGFGDPSWRVLKGDARTVQREGNSLVMEAETSIGSPQAMGWRELKFHFQKDGVSFSMARLNLFCAGLDAAHAAKLIVGFSGNQVVMGLESDDNNGLINQTQTNISSDQPVEVRLTQTGIDLEAYVNGERVQKFAIPQAKRLGLGMVIEPASVWGNTVVRIHLTSLVATAAMGRTWEPNVDAQTKSEALTVPRFRRDDPPRHALVASNGDVLHGEIEAITASSFGFRSGLERLSVPRDRVKAAIWLKKPDPNAPPPSPVNPTKALLDHPLNQRGSWGNANLQTLINVVERQESGLKFKLPKSDQRAASFQFGNQTIGETLDEICSQFEMCYHVDADGTIVIEPLSEKPTDLLERTYWLKKDAVPPSPPLQDLLASKGLTFPPGASASWQRDGGELILRDTAINQDRLQKVVASDFGGALGSPNYWLLLANGGRLGLAVDHFGPEAVTGQHPLYGRCTVPISEIYSIHAARPGPNATAEALRDWRLVFAPEPTLPEAGDASSALLGQPAPVFKLPLLEGGEYDLAAQKTPVIVLDFWATWCGPCIKSMPGLIEALSAFPPDQVQLLGINQAEAPEDVKHFMEVRKWNLRVALDAKQSVETKYGSSDLPFTVVIAPDKKVAWVRTGYDPDGEDEITEVVKKLLAPPAAEKGK